jgi:4a-hydroxytetrahydrobiopterin dehydratase
MDWQEIDGKLQKDFKFEDFTEAIDFVNEAAKIANEMGHHPDIFIHDYRLVTFTLFTHKEGKITEKDKELGLKIDEEFKKYSRMIL